MRNRYSVATNQEATRELLRMVNRYVRNVAHALRYASSGSHHRAVSPHHRKMPEALR